MFVTLNNTATAREVVIVVRPAENVSKARIELTEIADVARLLGDTQSEDALRRFAGQVVDLAKPVPVGESGA